MKTWKRALIGLVAIIVLGFAVVGCDNGNGGDDKTYTVTIGTLTNSGGSTIVAEPSSGKEGTEITLMITETYSYQLKAGTLKYGSTAINEVTGKFNLPAENVIITAEFVSSLFGTWYNEFTADVITFFENNTWAWGSTGYSVEPVTRYMWKGTWIPNGYSVILTETHIRNDNAYVTVNEITDVVADPRNFTCKFLPDRTLEIDWGNDTKEGFTLNPVPVDQSQIITLTFGTETPTATVKGHLTNTEWNGVANKIRNAINGRFETLVDESKDLWKGVFAKNITLNVEKTSEYTSYKVIGENEACLNFGILDNAETLRTALNRIVSVLSGNTNTATQD